MTDYNGWTNYETWCVNLWLTNEWDVDDFVDEMMSYHHGTPSPAEQISYLAVQLQSMVHQESPDLGASLYADLLGAALSEVNWYEIAENLLQGAGLLVRGGDV